MWPSSASISRLASRNSVVLPEPEPPTMARNSLPATSIETSSTALTRPPSKLLPTCANAIRGVVGIRERPQLLPSPGGGGSAHIERSENVRRGGVISQLGHFSKGETVTPPLRSFHSRRPSPFRGG